MGPRYPPPRARTHLLESFLELPRGHRTLACVPPCLAPGSPRSTAGRELVLTLWPAHWAASVPGRDRLVTVLLAVGAPWGVASQCSL